MKVRNHQQGWLAPFVGPRCRIHRQDAATSAVPRGVLHLPTMHLAAAARASCRKSCCGKISFFHLLLSSFSLRSCAAPFLLLGAASSVWASRRHRAWVARLVPGAPGSAAGTGNPDCSGPAPAASPPPPDPSKMQPAPPALSQLLLGLVGGSAGDTPNARTSVRLAVLGALLCS